APAPRTLSDKDAETVKGLEQSIDRLRGTGAFDKAIAPAREREETCRAALGPDHWQTADARRAVADLERIAALPEEGRGALASVGALEDEADAAMQRGRYAESERVWRVLLDIRRRWLGEDHPDTAASSNNLAFVLVNQGKYAEAEPLFRRALAIHLKAL